jgi:hypothetical protein
MPINHIEPIRVHNLAESSPEGSSSIDAELSELPRTPSEIDQAIKSQSNQHLEDTMRVRVASNDHNSDRPEMAPSVTIPVSQSTVIPERIGIISTEPQLQIPDIKQELVPAIPLLERKLQKVMPEVDSQPQTIQVTIGRIEVKATIPPSPPKPGGPLSSTMSLDEYLRRRQGGER